MKNLSNYVYIVLFYEIYSFQELVQIAALDRHMAIFDYYNNTPVLLKSNFCEQIERTILKIIDKT